MAKLKLEIGANITALQAGLSRAKSLVSGFAGAIGAGLSAAGLVMFAKSAINAADAVADGSKRIGLSAEEYQKLSFAAEQSGASIETIETAFKKMSSTVTDAIGGNKTAIATLNGLGISLDEVKGKTPNQLFELMADALGQVTDKTQQAAMAQDIFGKSGMQLIPMLGTFKELGQEIEDAGGIMSNEAVAAADAFNDSMNKLVTTLKSVVVNSGLAVWLKDVSEGMSAVVSNSQLLKKTDTATTSSSYTGGVSGFFGNLKDAYFGESEGKKLNSYAPDVKKAIEDKKAESAKKTDREKLAAESKAYAEQQKKADELYGKAGIDEYNKFAKEEKAISDSIQALQEKINIQKLLNDGKAKEAAIQEAINQAEDKAGRSLSDGEKSTLSDLAGQEFDLSQKAAGYNPQAMESAISTDSVKRIGGSIGGASNVNFAKDQLTVQKEISTVLKQVKENMTSTQAGQVWA